MSDTPVWYYNLKGKAQGPMSFEQLKAVVAKGDLRGHDLVFKEGGSEWKRASEWEDLAALFEDNVGSGFTKFIKLPEEERTVIRTDNKPPDTKWIILVRYEEDKEIRFKQKGPYFTDEVKQMLREKKISQTNHIWKKGAPKWIPIADVPEFHASQLDVTDELRQVMKEAAVLPTHPEVPAEKPAPVKPIVPEPEEQKTDVSFEVTQELTPTGGIVAKEPAPSKPEIPASRSQIIPVIPHVVPTGGSAKTARTESFGGTEAQVFSPMEEQTAKVILSEVEPEKPAVEPEAPAPVAVETPRIPLRVEPRAEPRRPDIAKAMKDDSENSRSWIGRLAPVMMILLFVSMGAGIWATLRTRSPILNADRPVPVQEASKTASVSQASSVSKEPAPAAPKMEVRLGGATSPEESEPTEEEIFDKEVAEVTEETIKKTVAPAEAKKKYGSPPAAKPAPKEVKEVKEAKAPPPPPAVGSDLPNISSVPKSTTLKVNNKAGFFEVIGSFRKGELLEIRIDGETGAILDLPALHQRLEVRALKNFVHRISLNDLRIPKGNYQFSVKWASSRSSKKLLWGAEKGQLDSALIMHRKQIAFDQQQEKKKILKSLKEFISLLAKAEQEAGKGNLKVVQKDLMDKMPAEIKIVRLSRHELIFSDQWEKMANQWDRIQAMAKEGGRGPASVSEIGKAKKAMNILEQKLKDQSIFEN